MNLTRFPHAPGIYLMRDSSARLLYIGKAKDLNKRVSSYFQNRDLSPKLVVLLSLVREIDYIPTASERESLLLEQKLIRRFQPLYNTLWRDDKSYPYLKLTLNEDFPRLILTRQKKKDDASYFGPYPNVSVIKKLLRTLWRKKIFPLRPCAFPFRQKDIIKEGGLEAAQPSLYKKVKSCVYLHTRECPAPCMKRISQKDYRKIADVAALFLKGKQEPLQIVLKKEMDEAAGNLEYEKAAHIRDQLSALRHLSERVLIKEVDEHTIARQTQTSRAITDLQEKLHCPLPPTRIEAFDISNIGGSNPVASMVVFENGKPLKSEYRKYKIKTVVGQNDFAMMAEVVRRRYRRLMEEEKKFPNLILLDGGKGQLSAALNALKFLKKAPPIVALAKENEEIFVPNRAEAIVLPKDAPALHLLQALRDEAHRFAVAFHRHKRKKSFFASP